MISWTNKHNLPEPYVRAVVNDPYSRGASDFSATGLANPARANAILEVCNVSVDVSSRADALIGQGMHSIAERAARETDICEERFFADFDVDGKLYTISSQIDLYERDTQKLYDWKTTKAFAFSKKSGNGKKPEWVAQLNIAAEIMRRQGHDPKSLHIIALLKDWTKRDAASGSHPPLKVIEVDLPVWTPEETTAHIEERVRAQVRARTSLPQCSAAETWYGRRCSDWCDASSACDQYKEATKTGVI